MGEDKRGRCDVADFATAGGDVLKGAPTAGDRREPAFARQRSERSRSLRVRAANRPRLRALSQPNLLF
jgi:hypothetical protein